MKYVYPHQAAAAATSQEIVSRGAAPREHFRDATREQSELDADAAKENVAVESAKDSSENFTSERAREQFSLDE